MKLLIDCGNSRLKWACLDRGNLTAQQAMASGSQLSHEALDDVWGTLGLVPGEVWIANVAGDKVACLLLRWIESRWRMIPKFVASQGEGYGVTNGYEHPEKLGVDRWLALIGAFHHYPLPACIVDCGTALTLDVLDRQGRHRGGLICPGLRLMVQSLGRGTADVGFDVTALPNAILAAQTSTAVGLGVHHAAAGMIERVMRAMAADLPELHLILTGGDATEMASLIGGQAVVAPELVLRGLAEVCRRQ